jgi:hypothetical protein
MQASLSHAEAIGWTVNDTDSPGRSNHFGCTARSRNQGASSGDQISADFHK